MLLVYGPHELEDELKSSILKCRMIGEAWDDGWDDDTKLCMEDIYKRNWDWIKAQKPSLSSHQLIDLVHG